MRHEPAGTDGSLATAGIHRGHRSRFGRRLRSYGLVVPLVALAAACGGGSEEAAPEPTPTSAVEQSVPKSGSLVTNGATRKPTATTVSRPTVTEPAAATLANGTHFVYLAAVDPGRRTISVDLVQVLDPASAEAAKVCPEIAEGGHDGYCIKNVNGRLRTVPVDAKASLQVLNGSSLRSVDMRGLAAARDGQKEDNFFQVTVSGGRVASAKELFRA